MLIVRGRSKVKVVLVVFLVALISACGSHRIKSEKPYAPDVSKGLVIFSFTQSGLIQAPFRFHYRSKNGTVEGSVKVSKPLDWSMGAFKAVTKENEYIGEVIVLQLPEGEYEFYELTIDNGYMGGDWDGGTTVSFPFTVMNGAAEYIGNLHVLATMGLQHALGETLRLRYGRNDMRERDLPVFHSRYRHIDAGDVTFSYFNSLEKN